VHPLYAKGYKTIGCDLPCTTPSLEGEDIRAGRWRWEEASKKECTLHLDGYKDGAGI
jgi:phosphoadenosine phosphosulfate reductase